MHPERRCPARWPAAWTAPGRSWRILWALLSTHWNITFITMTNPFIIRWENVKQTHVIIVWSQPISSLSTYVVTGPGWKSASLASSTMSSWTDTESENSLTSWFWDLKWATWYEFQKIVYLELCLDPLIAVLWFQINVPFHRQSSTQRAQPWPGTWPVTCGTLHERGLALSHRQTAAENGGLQHSIQLPETYYLLYLCLRTSYFEEQSN